MKIKEIIRESQYPAFLDNMIDATTQAQAGFHFEEGGCWGMALALRDALGPEANLVVGYLGERPSHALVSLGGALYDHQGRTTSDLELRVVSEDELMRIAESSVVTEEEVDEDRRWAATIIEMAAEM